LNNKNKLNSVKQELSILKYNELLALCTALVHEFYFEQWQTKKKQIIASLIKETADENTKKI
jgi:hypothetical protein